MEYGNKWRLRVGRATLVLRTSVSPQKGWTAVRISRRRLAKIVPEKIFCKRQDSRMFFSKGEKS